MSEDETVEASSTEQRKEGVDGMMKRESKADGNPIVLPLGGQHSRLLLPTRPSRRHKLLPVSPFSRTLSSFDFGRRLSTLQRRSRSAASTSCGAEAPSTARIVRKLARRSGSRHLPSADV